MQHCQDLEDRIVSCAAASSTPQVMHHGPAIFLCASDGASEGNQYLMPMDSNTIHDSMECIYRRAPRHLFRTISARDTISCQSCQRHHQCPETPTQHSCNLNVAHESFHESDHDRDGLSLSLDAAPVVR